MTDCVANKGDCCSGSVRSGTYGNAYDVAQITIDKCGRITRIKNVAIDGTGFSQWSGTKGYPIYYIPNVSIGSSSNATSNLQVTGNVYVSNAVTSGNMHVTDTLDVLGSMTANAANATFFFDTFTIPYINTQYLNVVSNTTLSGNLVASTANIATLNVGYLTVNSAVVYGTSTLNVYGTSNLSTVYSTGNVYVGSNPTNRVANVQFENINMFIGNSYWTSTNSTNNVVGPPSRLIFDNTTTPYAANKILLHSNTASANICGFGVVGVYNTVPMTLAYYTSGDHSFAIGSNQNFGGFTAMSIRSTGVIDMDGNSRAKLDIGTLGLPSSNTTVRIDGSNVALVTSGSGLVGFGTTAPSANLHVIGNVYASNAVTTTNVFATRFYGDGGVLSNLVPTGTNGQVLYFSNSKITTTSNIFLSTSNLVGIGTTSPGYLLDVVGPGAADGYAVNVSRFKSTSASFGSGILIDATNVTGGKACSIWTTGALASEGAGKLLLGHQFSVATAPLIVDMNILTVGVGVTSPTANLHVSGNVYVSNALTATNVFAATEVLTGTTGQTTLNVTGNVYASNALTTTNVLCTSLVATNPTSFKNRIINGDFLIDQRNAGSNSTPTTDTKTIDRWKVNIFGSGRCLVGQNLGAVPSPTTFTSYYGMKVTTTTVVGAGDYFFLSQVIEGVNTVDWLWGSANARPVTFSFWVYSSLTGTMGGFVRNAGATAGNYSRSYPFTFSVSSANTWEYKTITISGDTTGQWISGQLDGPEFGIELWNGSTYQGTAGAWAAANYTGPSGGTANFAGTLNSYMYLTGLQVELGPVATPYERRHINFELAACQRYYEPSIARFGGYHTAGNFLRSSVYFNTKKRPAGTPTFTVISQLENNNMGSLNFDNSNFDQSSARILASVTATGDAYGQWKVSVDCEF